MVLKMAAYQDFLRVLKIFLCRYQSTKALYSHFIHLSLSLYSILLLHRACCRVTQLLHQPLHIYKICKIYTLKH